MPAEAVDKSFAGRSGIGRRLVYGSGRRRENNASKRELPEYYPKKNGPLLRGFIISVGVSEAD